MTVTTDSNTQQMTISQLDSVLSKSMDKVKASSESEMCHYIADGENRLHHLSFHRLKSKAPEKLASMLKQFILDAEVPQKFPPKPRKPRQPRTSKNHFVIDQEDMAELISALKDSENHALYQKLKLATTSPKEIKRQMIGMIRAGEVDEELWDSYKSIIQP